MTLLFRNVDADPADPVSTWPYEALVAAIERGSVLDWARIVGVVEDDPWGDVARQVEEYLSYGQPYGVAPLLQRAITRGRTTAEESERREVAAEVADLIGRTGLSMSAVASRLGTSRSRLSTYRSGRVVPAATLLVRLRRLAARIEEERF